MNTFFEGAEPLGDADGQCKGIGNTARSVSARSLSNEMTRIDMRWTYSSMAIKAVQKAANWRVVALYPVKTSTWISASHWQTDDLGATYYTVDTRHQERDRVREDEASTLLGPVVDKVGDEGANDSDCRCSCSSVCLCHDRGVVAGDMRDGRRTQTQDVRCLDEIRHGIRLFPLVELMTEESPSGDNSSERDEEEQTEEAA